MEIPFNTIAQALSEFNGVYRRFEIKGEKNGALVIDDYGHHPTEIEATLKAAKDGLSPPGGGGFSAASLQPDTGFLQLSSEDRSFRPTCWWLPTSIRPGKSRFRG